MSDEHSAVNEQKVIGGAEAPEQLTASENEQRKAMRDYSKAGNGSQQPSMRVKVYSPFRDYFDGPAFSVTAENATGTFDVLPQHHSFISLLSPCNLIIRTTGQGDQKIQISGGLLHVKSDSVVVFLDV